MQKSSSKAVSYTHLDVYKRQGGESEIEDREKKTKKKLKRNEGDSDTESDVIYLAQNTERHVFS